MLIASNPCQLTILATRLDARVKHQTRELIVEVGFLYIGIKNIQLSLITLVSFSSPMCFNVGQFPVPIEILEKRRNMIRM